MSKKLFSPKSPFAEILVNFPFSILPINLKFFRFSDKGAIILVKSISISLLIWENKLFEFFCLIIFGKFVASIKFPSILIFFPYKIKKSLLVFLSLVVLTEIFFKDKNLLL